MSNTYLVSVKPQWASLFFDRTNLKSVELRKGNFGKALILGDRLLIYATLPKGKILGSVIFCDRKELPISELRAATEHLAQVSTEDFGDYYQGKDTGVGVWVNKSELFESPIPLDTLKSAGVTPPQQITKLTPEQVESLLPTVQEEKPLQPESPIQEVENRPLIRAKPQTTNRSVPELMVEIELLITEIQELYLQGNPLVIGWSGGKDSTTVLQLIWNAVRQLPIVQRIHKIYVLTNDTLVENPIVSAQVRNSLKQMERAAQEQGMPIVTHMTTPAVENTFWVSLIGKGYAAPRNQFRWCTERLKITPADEFIRSTIIATNGSIVLALGVRKTESVTRAASMAKQREFRVSDRLNLNPNHPGSLTYSPIEDWRTDEVWLYLMQWENPWGNNNKDLLTMYRGATADNECPLVVDTSTPSCGSSRFGCWVCTLVDQDKSMAAMILNDDDKEWMQPLLDIRNELDVRNSKGHHDDHHRRDYRRMGGNVQLYKAVAADGGEILKPIPGPYTRYWREHWLRRVLEVQTHIRKTAPPEMRDITLITPEELSEIRHIWLEQKHEFDDSLPWIYEEATAEVFTDSRLTDKRTVLGETEWEVLKEVCDGDINHLDLMASLLSLTNKQRLSSRRVKQFEKLEQAFARNGQSREDTIKDAHEKHELNAAEGVEKIKLLMTKPATKSIGNQLSWADIKYQTTTE
jgi:DNA sulfur modification protein DndC